MEDQNIKSLFAQAERKRQEIEQTYDRNSTTYHDNLATAVGSYEECRVLADRQSLFSPNEILEDITTGDLPYLLIDYHLGDLYTRISNPDRQTALTRARTAYERFLNRLDSYAVLSGNSKKLNEAYNENPTTFSTISTTDFTARRAAKIDNFKLEKDLKQKIDFLSRNPAYLSQDDDAIRDLHLANISLSTHNTFQNLESLNLEMSVLASKPPTPPPGPESLARDYRERTGARTGDNYSDRLDRPISELLAGNNAPGPLLDKSGKPLKVFTLTGGRKQLQDGVFRSGHNLPTMSIDEYLEEERKRGGIIEGGGEASGIIAEPDEDDYEKGEAETLKARAWDEYVEENPKGAGNTLNRG
ncbi:hypothetical protein V493_06970 [Pseudogymnoascus sp. VKM F-4281 (FW-2241)]|nr:hypothetical protein V493_06970 [Pseudogymnoascus sp. VKM F-4281 (FW-2241)]